MIFDTFAIQNDYLEYIRRVGETSRGIPRLVCVSSSDNVSTSFAESLRKRGNEVGMLVEIVHPSTFWEPVITMLNDDDMVHGILISPPEHLKNYHSLIKDCKNVEGNDYDDRLDRVSCTAQAILRITAGMIWADLKDEEVPTHLKDTEHPVLSKLEQSGESFWTSDLTEWITHLINGLRVVIAGYGKAIGKPLSYLLMRYHAGSVTTIHQYTSSIEKQQSLYAADVIVCATGVPGILEESVVPGHLHGKYIIDAGIAVKDGKVVGDIDADKFSDNNMVTRVPGGVGAVTTSMILYNTARAAQYG